MATYSPLASWSAATHARSLAANLQDELARPSSAAAAFGDLAGEYARPSVSAQRLVGLRRTFLDAVRITGRQQKSTMDLLQALLVDYARTDVLGDSTLTLPPDLRATVDGVGIENLPDTVRVRLVEACLAQSIPTVRQTVWIAYRAAHLGGHDVIEVGHLTFFDGSTLAERVRSWRMSPTPGTDPLLDELCRNDRPKEVWFDEPADVEHWAVVRVELQTGAYNGPLAKARGDADFAIAEARADAIFSTPSTWIPLEGYRISTGTRIESQRFHVALERPMLFADTVGDTLGSMGRYPPVRQPPAWLVEVHRGFDRTDEQLGAESLLADVRAIEAIAHRFGLPGWQGLLERFLTPGWTSGRLRALLFNSVSTLLNETVDDDTVALTKQRAELRDLVVRPAGRHQNFSNVAAIDAVPVILRTFPESRFSRRVLSNLWMSVGTPSGRKQIRRSFTQAHHENIDRAARCRNSLVHGTPTSAGVVKQAAKFIHQQAGSVIAIARRADSNGVSGESELDTVRTNMDTILFSFDKVTGPADALSAFLR